MHADSQCVYEQEDGKDSHHGRRRSRSRPVLFRFWFVWFGLVSKDREVYCCEARGIAVATMTMKLEVTRVLMSSTVTVSVDFDRRCQRPTIWSSRALCCFADDELPLLNRSFCVVVILPLWLR